MSKIPVVRYYSESLHDLRLPRNPQTAAKSSTNHYHTLNEKAFVKALRNPPFLGQI